MYESISTLLTVERNRLIFQEQYSLEKLEQETLFKSPSILRDRLSSVKFLDRWVCFQKQSCFNCWQLAYAVTIYVFSWIPFAP